MYIYDGLDDSGSGEELEQERLALENDSDEPPTEETQIIKGLCRVKYQFLYKLSDPEFWKENDRKIAARFAKRKQRLRDFCENYYRNISAAGKDVSYHDWSHKSRHFYVGDGPHQGWILYLILNQ